MAQADSSMRPNTELSVVVSIHDVTPAFADRVQQLWTLCKRHGWTPALLVVPNWHGQWSLATHPQFVSWLRTCADSGAEIVLHGERHDEAGLRRGVADSLRALGRTNREGEFLTLDAAAARGRIERGLHVLRELTLPATGFIPPAWLARDTTHDVVRDAGLLFSEDAGSIHLHRAGRRLRTPVVRWSARSAWRASMSALVANVRWHGRRRTPLIRIALHPQDLDHPVAAASVAREVERWAQHARQVRYDAL